MSGRLEGRVAVVTGGARGLGAAVAQAVAAEGAAVLVADVRDDLGEALCAQLRAAGGAAAYAHLDVCDPRQWEAAVARATASWGAPDLLVNNAAIVRLAAIAEETEEGWQEVLDVALTGAFNGMRAVVPGMRAAGGGAIVNVTSTAALAAVPGVAAYHAAKGALLALSRAAAVSYAGEGIRVNALVPGSMRTPMVDELDGLGALQQEEAAATPLGRVLSTEEVAAAVVHLLSDDAAYSIGSALAADGGALAM